MKRFHFSDISFAALVICGLLNLAFNITSTTKQEDKPITLEDFNRQINKKDTLVLVYFSAQWCTVCGKMKPVLQEIEKDFGNKLCLLKIDTDRDKEITTAFDIDALPVFMIYKNGCQEWVYVGLVDKAVLRGGIKKYL